MRDRFIGDSLDFVKRDLLRLVREVGLKPLVCPLPAETSFDVDVYCRVLGIELTEVFDPGFPFRAHARQRHVDALVDTVRQRNGDQPNFVLLDPDKGLHREKRRNLFLTLPELERLLAHAPETIFCVYHHRLAGSLYFDDIAESQGASSFGYDAGAATLAFFQARGKTLAALKKSIASSWNPARIL